MEVWWLRCRGDEYCKLTRAIIGRITACMIGHDKEIKYSHSGISQIIQLYSYFYKICVLFVCLGFFNQDDRSVVPTLFNNLYFVFGVEFCFINFHRSAPRPGGLVMIQAPVICAHRNVRSTWHDRSAPFIKASSCISLLISLAEDNLINLHLHAVITRPYTANTKPLSLSLCRAVPFSVSSQSFDLKHFGLSSQMLENAEKFLSLVISSKGPTQKRSKDPKIKSSGNLLLCHRMTPTGATTIALRRKAPPRHNAGSMCTIRGFENKFSAEDGDNWKHWQAITMTRQITTI